MKFKNNESNTFEFALVDSLKVDAGRRRYAPLNESKAKRKKTKNKMQSVKCCVFESASSRSNSKKIVY